MSSITEEASTDLKSARILLHKIGTTFTNFQSHTLAIFSLGEEWKILQTAFAKVHKSLEDRVKELESKERENSSMKKQLQFAAKEVELRKSKLAFEEKSLSERVVVVEIREKQVKEWFESLELEKRIVDDRRKAVEVAEKRFSEAVEVRENKVRKREEVVFVKENELNVFDEGLRLKESELKTKEAKLEEKGKELGLKEKEVNELYEGLKSKENELKMMEATLEENRNVLGLKEKELYEGFKVKENELKMKEAILEENKKELGLKENELYKGLMVKDGEVIAKVLALEQKEAKYLEDRKLIDELFDVLHLNEKLVGDKSEKLALQEEEIESRCREVEAKEKELNERLEELKAKEKQINDSCDVLESQGKKVDDQSQRLEMKEKEIDELRRELDLKRKTVVERCEEAERKAEQAEKMTNATIYKCNKAEKKIVYLPKELKSKEKELNEHCHKVKESQEEKQVNENSVISRCLSKGFKEDSLSVSQIDEQPDPNIGHQVSCTVDSLPSNACDGLHLMCKNMDVSSLRSYLMDRVHEQKSLHDKMLDALRCAPDPAKLALNVFRSFHQKFPSKSLSRANKTSCIFVLEKLMKLSPPIPYKAKVDAKKFAEQFREALKRCNSAPADSLGFLLLVATFKLEKFYNADDLVYLLHVYYSGGDIYQLEENSYLCSALGLLEKIPGFVTSLIERKKHLSAVKFICIFKLERDFPLEPLLQAQLNYIKNKVQCKRINKHGALKSKNKAIQANSTELGLLNDLIELVKVFKLEPIFPIDSLLSRVNELEREKEARKANSVARRKKYAADSCPSVNSAALTNQPEKLPSVAALVKKRNADDSCASAASSVAMSNQLEKRRRVGDVPQVAPRVGHPTHVNPNLQGPVVPAFYGFGPHHMGLAPFVPPAVYPFGAPRPFC